MHVFLDHLVEAGGRELRLGACMGEPASLYDPVGTIQRRNALFFLHTFLLPLKLTSMLKCISNPKKLFQDVSGEIPACQKCKIIDTTYSSWKNRNRLPSLEDILILSQELNISLQWLITGTESAAISLPTFQEDEQQLLDYYSQCNPEGKNRILEQSEFIAAKYPQQGKSSEYKIG